MNSSIKENSESNKIDKSPHNSKRGRGKNYKSSTESEESNLMSVKVTKKDQTPKGQRGPGLKTTIATVATVNKSVN